MTKAAFEGEIAVWSVLIISQIWAASGHIAIGLLWVLWGGVMFYAEHRKKPA